MRYTRKHLPAALFRTLAALALLAATAYALVPSGDGAQAQTCPDAVGQPTPTEIEVTAVPIVVESTTADYFVLYVSHYVDGATVEQPVRVVLGEDGGTTLAENVAALPNERYRVEKYLIADPADVDGDCTDDITELGDTVIKSPVNPAAITSFRYGAVAIPDQETFESLGEVYPSGRVRLKFILVDMDTGRPGVYFMNQNWFLGEHDTFLGTIGVERERATRGTVLYDPHVVAPGGSQGVYRFRIHDPRSSFSFFERANTLLAANLPLLDDNLTLWIRSSALPLIQPELPSFRASRLNLVFDDDVYGDTGFIALSQGEGYGLLRHMGTDDRPSSRDVVIYETLPNELPRVAGIISTGPQTPLSHVNLRALQDGVPNAFIAGALDDETLDDLIDSYVHYAVAERGYTIRAASQSEVEAHHASSRPAEAQTPERDLSVTSVTPLGDIGFDDWDSFGVKAANVAVLGTLGFPEGTVPDGFAVPFYFYDEFMKHNGFYDDIGEMLADPDFQTDYDTKAEELKKLRKRIKRAETPERIVAALAAMHASYPEGTSLRYRSSTNNEDLPGFNGAGLYDSKTQHPEETVEDGIDKSLKQVYASLWNFRALVERDFHRIDHLAAAMGVLVHPNYSDESVNGVAVSVAPSVGGDGSYYVNSQVGEDLVTNPEAHSVPEEAVLNADGTFTVVAFSNRAPAGQALMTDDQWGQLRRHLAAIHERFAELYGIEDGEEFAMEIEFKITSDDVLAIKQARPWVFGGTLTGNFDVVPVLQTTLANGVDSSSAPPAVGYSVYGGFGALPDRSFTIDGRSYDIVFILQSVEAIHLGLSAATERSFTLQLGDETYEARESSTLNAAAKYWWPNKNPTWSDGQEVGIAIAAAHPESALMPERAAAPPTARLRSFPGAHDGVNAFDVHLRITKPVLADAERMASHAIVVQGGAVEGARTTHKTTDSWLISVRPSGSDAVRISVAEASQCSDPEALCDSDGMMLHNHPRVLIPGPPPNNPATGAPGISGTAHVGQTLTASTSNIADADGLADVTYAYQWIRRDGTTDTDIAGQTDATYAPVPEDLGNSVKVRVSFTDDAGHEESLTSAATAAVELSRDRPHRLRATAEAGAVTLTWQDPNTHPSYSSYHILRHRPELGETEPLIHKEYAFITDRTFTDSAVEPGVLYAYAVRAADAFGYLGPASAPAEVRATPVEGTNSPAGGAPTIAGAVRVGETLTAGTSGMADADGLSGATFAYQWVSSDGTADADILGATGSTYTVAASDLGRTLRVRVSFTDDAGNEETLTSAATAPAAAAIAPPLTADFGETTPQTHDGRTPFTFELRLSEEFELSHVTLRDHAFTVTGGTVAKARRLDKPSNIHWQVTVVPASNADVSVVLPVTTDCDDRGAICTADGGMLSNRNELTVAGPSGLSPQVAGSEPLAPGLVAVNGPLVTQEVYRFMLKHWRRGTDVRMTRAHRRGNR